jgi:PrgI family protein
VTYEIPASVPIPADVDRPDKIVAGLTARQAAIATVAAVIIWAGWQACRHLLPLPAFAALATPVGVAAAALVLGERDGLPLDRLLAAAWRQHRGPRRLVTAPEGIPAPAAWAFVPGPQPPPAVLAPLWQHIGADGVIGLGSAGAAAVAAVSTVNFALRSPAEQDALTAVYGRWLNSLTGPAQILVRAGRADLSAAVAALREAAPALPHPALEQAALEHAAFLDQLAADRDLLTRQALLILREPAHGAGVPGAGPAAGRALQRAGEAARLLAGAGLQVRVLDGRQVTYLLAACADPAAPPLPAGAAALPGQPVTAAGRPA